MRLRDQVTGGLNLFAASPGAFTPAGLRVGQALADVATIGPLQERHLRRSETLAEQLQAALNSRVVIEQVKGKLAERNGLDIDQAFQLLREHARGTNQRLTGLTRNLIDGTARPPTAQPAAAPPLTRAPGGFAYHAHATPRQDLPTGLGFASPGQLRGHVADNWDGFDVFEFQRGNYRVRPGAVSLSPQWRPVDQVRGACVPESAASS